MIKLLERHFEIALETPDGITKLRELILSLAVQGKLVPQGPKDEPVCNIYEKYLIKSYEKCGVLEDSNLKGWIKSDLGHFVEFLYGKGVPKDEIVSEGVPVYGANGPLKFCLNSLIDKPCIIVGRKGSAGALNISRTPCWPSDVTYYVLPSRIFEFEFLFYLLLSLNLPSLAKGIKPGINRKTVYALSIGIPPLKEQKRIVVKIDELMALCDKLEEERKERDRKRLKINTSAINQLVSASDKSEFNKSWKFIEQKFDDIYSVKENINELKKVILQLGVMGKLVSQNPKDEPVSGLLKKIELEKKRLIKEGKIKKQKRLFPIKSKEISYDVPKGWELVRFGELVEMYNGRAFKSTEWMTKGLPIVRIQNLNNSQAPFNYFDGEISNQHLIKDGTLLISWSGTPGTSFGAFIWDRGEAALNQHINKCQVYYEELNIEYLKFAVNGCMDHLISQAQGGVGLKHVTKGALNNMIFGLPPLAEQKRIVAKINQLINLCDKLEQILQDSSNKQEKILNAVLARV